MKKIILNFLTSLLLVQYLVAYNITSQGAPDTPDSGTEIGYSHLVGLNGTLGVSPNKSESYAWNKQDCISINPRIKKVTSLPDLYHHTALLPSHASIFSNTRHLRL